MPTTVKPYGTILIDDKEVAETLQCPHCNAHFEVTPGSKKKRGFCMNCMAATCGPRCHRCTPFEKRLERYESGKAKFL